MEEKSYNKAPGIRCPICKKGLIKLSLGDFLYDNKFICPCCNTEFGMDKSKCGPVLDKLQELYSVNKEVERLKKQSL
ncbi:MAG: hypothetical protein IKX42_02730 [Fibrobacter sp.]|nr:hypothetical protein [Fibrobacter sp.]